ncbi:glycogen phosphorylase [Escherichia coli]|uniref:Alpha-1,4 glucan phosphorylase n=1 Tax=Escherichia coli TaxID=562 RepID=A0A2X3J8J5_ECOLX|nr:glycogen phosphorylase [Escherichia coli]
MRLNGALTIGTLDGANVEMLDHVGADNIFIFGNTAEEVEELRRQGYKPREYYEKDEELHQVLTQIGSGVFSPEDPGRYRDLVDSLITSAITTRYWRIIAAMSIVRIKSMNSTSFRKSGPQKRC